MNRFERQGGPSADRQALPDAIPGESRQVSLAGGNASDAPPSAPLTKREIRTIILSLLLAMFLGATDQTIVATALPTIGAQFHDVSNLSWVVSAYLLASTAMAPVFGTLSDIYGRRAMIVWALSLFMAGSLVCALAPNMIVLIVGRGLQGLGGGGIIPIVYTVIADLVSARDRGRYQGYFSSVWAAASIGGPVLGGVFAEHLHWSLIFWINLPLGIASLVLLLPKMAKVPVYHRRRKVDWLGGLLIMASTVVFMLVLTWGGNRYAWLSPTIMAMAGASFALLLAFITQARRADEPFLPLPLLGGTVVPYALVSGAVAQGAITGLVVYLPLYLERAYGFTAAEAGFGLIPLALASTAGSTIAGRAMVYTHHYKRMAIIGISCAVVAGCVLATMTLTLWSLQVFLSLFAIGLGTSFSVTVVAVQNAVAQSQAGTANGVINFSRSLMGSLSVAAYSAILFMALGADIPLGAEHRGLVNSISPADMIAAFHYLFAASAAMLAVSLLSLALMEEKLLAGPAAAAPEVAE